MIWTKEKLETLKEKYSNADNVILEKELEISRGYIIKKANDLNLFKSKDFITKIRKRDNPQTHWSDQEVLFLKSSFKKHSNREILKMLKEKFDSKFTIKAIVKKLGRLGLKRTKEQADKNRSKAIKNRLTDLSYDHVISCAKKYNTKHEFYLKDPNAYNKVIKMGWQKEAFNHMVSGNFSIPQLMLKDILETLLKEKCSYNNRSVIAPLEIDIYFERWKIGWEYDGKRFHKHPDDKNKKDKCFDRGVVLFCVHEFTDNYKNYEENIKKQLLRDLGKINIITELSIKEECVISHKFKIKFPNQLTIKEKKLVFNKKMSNIKKVDLDLFKKIKKYKLYNEKSLKIEIDLPIYKRFSTHTEYINYLKEQEYSSFSDLCSKEHPHRLMKKWGQPISLIHELFK